MGFVAKRILLAVLVSAVSACADGRSAGARSPGPGEEPGSISDSAFAALIERLSEPGGYFDTDNLISNETSYLHVIGTLRELGVSGGAYIGVGPDQNFSYIAAIRPRMAFIIDIRRDNLLQHLLFKSLFELANNRIEYLCLLFARPTPRDADDWGRRSIERLAAYIDDSTGDLDLTETTLALVASTAAGFGYPLDEADIATIRRFHSAFIDRGLGLRFESHGRTPRPYYPTYRELMLERDLEGRRSNYLASEDDFQFLRSLQQSNLVVPVVGDLAGHQALAAIGEEIDRRGGMISAFYTSNVEFYLVQDRSFHQYARTVAALPYDSTSVIIRSYFGRNFGYVHPQAVPGYYSVQLLGTIQGFIDDYEAGRYRGYLDLVSRNTIVASPR
jgi:hypothetical protein